MRLRGRYRDAVAVTGPDDYAECKRNLYLNALVRNLAMRMKQVNMSVKAARRAWLPLEAPTNLAVERVAGGAPAGACVAEEIVGEGVRSRPSDLSTQCSASATISKRKEANASPNS